MWLLFKEEGSGIQTTASYQMDSANSCFIRVTVVTAANETLWEDSHEQQIHINDKPAGWCFKHKTPSNTIVPWSFLNLSKLLAVVKISELVTITSSFYHITRGLSRPLRFNSTNEIISVSRAEMFEEVKSQSAWCWGEGLCSREAV